MPDFDYDGWVSVDVDDFLSACDRHEIQEIIDALEEDGHIKPSQRNAKTTALSPAETIFEEALTKLHGKWNQLSKSEEEILMAIAKRF